MWVRCSPCSSVWCLPLPRIRQPETVGVTVPLLATQLLWINLLTDAAPALAMGVDPQTDDVMGRKPRKVTDRVIDASMWGDIIYIGVIMPSSR